MDHSGQDADLSRKLGRIGLFDEIGKTLVSGLEFQSILQTIMERLSGSIEADRWCLLMADKAMYLAKNTRRNSLAVANEGIRA